MSKIFFLIFSFIQVASSYSQFDMELSKYYLTSGQLASNRVKKIIIHKENDVVINLNADGFITNIKTSKNGELISHRSYFYLNDVLFNIEEIRSNYKIEYDFEYKNSHLNKIKVFENRYHSSYYDVSTYENGWISFIAEMRYQNPNPMIKELWTKSIKYFSDGSIKSIKRHSGNSDHFSKFIYNETTGHIERESIDIYIRNEKYKVHDWYISTYSNGLTKSISDGSYEQKIEYEYFTYMDLDLLRDSINHVKENLTSIDSLLGKIHRITFYEFNTFNKSCHSYYNAVIDELIKENKYSKKIVILEQLIKVFESIDKLEVSEIKKVNRKLKLGKLSYYQYFNEFI